MTSKSEKLNKVFKLFIYIILVTIIIVLSALYITNEKFRNTFDEIVLKRNVSQNNLTSIEINSETTQGIYAYDKYITVLSKNVLTSYNSSGKEESKIDVRISKPIIASNEKYMVIAEQNGKKVYLISGSNLLWQEDLDGSISKVNVNKNGYVTVIITNSTYKSIVVTFNPNGRELFRRYLSKTLAIGADISSDNKYLAIGEIDYSGTAIKSTVEILSMELAQTKSEDPIVYQYDSESGKIVTDLKYIDKDSVVCMFNDYVQIVKINDSQKITDITTSTLFCNIGLKNSVAKLEKQQSSLLSYEYQLDILNVNTKSENMYIVEGMPKTIDTVNDIIIINFGSEVQIINTSGWLVKKYTSLKQINDIVASDNIVGIVYKDKIEIIKL